MLGFASTSLGPRKGATEGKGKKQAIGEKGEAIALRYLTKKGYHLVQRNWRCRMGEIDLVLRDQNALVFVEVKTRVDRAWAASYLFESVDARKKRKLRMLVEVYLLRYYSRMPSPPVRIDVVGILLKENSFETSKVEHMIGVV